jgi:RNA polymerase sigma factor (sigma-70 family)
MPPLSMSPNALPIQAAEPSPPTLRLIAPGGPAAWTELYAAHRPWMRSLVEGRIPPRLQARFDHDDVVQTAFLALCCRPAAIDAIDVGSVKNFLGEVMRNGLRDQVRHHTRQRRNADKECDASEHVLAGRASQQEMPLEVIEKAERQAALVTALGELPQGDQELVRLKYVEQRSWVEVGRELGLSETTARRRGLEALDRLMRHLI